MQVNSVIDKMEQFFERHKLPILTQTHLEILNCPVSTKEIVFIIKNILPSRKKKKKVSNTRQVCFAGKFCQS